MSVCVCVCFVCVWDRERPVKYDPGCLGSIHFQQRLLMAVCPPIVSLNDSEVITYLILTSGIDWLTERGMMDRWVAGQMDGKTDGRTDNQLRKELISLIQYARYIWLSLSHSSVISIINLKKCKVLNVTRTRGPVCIIAPNHRFIMRPVRCCAHGHSALLLFSIDELKKKRATMTKQSQ